MAKVKPPRRPKMFRDRNPVTTVTPEAAQRAHDKSEESKIAYLATGWSKSGDHQWVDNTVELLDKGRNARIASYEALKDRETPRKVTANRRRERNLRGDS
jgi:hypothetical protein